MLHGLLTRLLVSSVALLYPGYASFKALSQTPTSQAELERLLTYWSVLGCLGGVEYAAEFIVSWIPFYYSVKTLFLLYLIIPQTQGSLYVYKGHLEPFLKSQEAEIDAWYARYKAFAYKCILNHFNTVWGLISASVGQSVQAGSPGEQSNAAPGLQTVVSAVFNVFGGLFKLYAPTVLAVGSYAGKQLARSARSAIVNIAAQVDAALAASKEEELAKQNAAQNKKDVQSEIGVVPFFPMPVPMPTSSTPELPSAPAPAPVPVFLPEPIPAQAPEPHEAAQQAPPEMPVHVEVPFPQHFPQQAPVPPVQAMPTALQEQLPQLHAQPYPHAFAPMPFPGLTIIPQVFPSAAEPEPTGHGASDHHHEEQHVPSPEQPHPSLMSLAQMAPFLTQHFSAPIPAFMPTTAHIAPESAGSVADVPIVEVVPPAETNAQSAEAAAAGEAPTSPATVPALHKETVKDVPPPPPPTAATAAASSSEASTSTNTSAHPHSTGALPVPVLAPLLWMPPVIS